MLQNDPLRLPSFHFDADPDPDPASHFDEDPDPTSQNYVDPCGSGSETLVWSLLNFCWATATTVAMYKVDIRYTRPP
jgi:hypothetical protein